ISEAIGWRGVYLVSSGLLVATAVVLFFALPQERSRDRYEYRHLITGGITMMRHSRELRRRGWFGGTAFGAFSVLWSTLAFHLSSSPFHYSSGVIGLFGLFGMAGILSANIAGRLADEGRTALATRSAAFLIAVGFAVLFVGRTNVWFIVAGTIILDAGAQGIHVANQSIIYSLAPNQRSTINSIYMVCFLTGAALGSLFSGYAYAHFGWNGTCVVGAVLERIEVDRDAVRRTHFVLTAVTPADRLRHVVVAGEVRLQDREDLLGDPFELGLLRQWQHRDL